MLGTPRPGPTTRLTMRRRVGLAAVGILLAACSQAARPATELEGWRRSEVISQANAIEFDRVAATRSINGVSWVSRAPGTTDRLVHHELRADGKPEATALAAADSAVVIPVAVASESDGFAAVAVTREQAHGENTGLVAWTAPSSAGEPVPEPLAFSTGASVVPPRTTVGRAGGVTVVAGIIDGRIETLTAPAAQPGWQASRPDLGRDDLITADVAGDGERLVLAAVDRNGQGHVWTSTDGETWQPVKGSGPGELGTVTLLGPIARGQMAIAWLHDDADQDPQFSAEAATIQVLAGDELDDRGTVEPADGSVQLSLHAATKSPDGKLTVTGAAWNHTRDRTPMVWVQDHAGWVATSQAELAGRVGFELRAIATNQSDDSMVAIVTPATGHIDVELWEWRRKGA